MSSTFIYINCDGGIDKKRGYCAFVVKNGAEKYLGSRSFIVEGTSNECEYHGVIAALEWLRGGWAWEISATIRCDSRLVLQQIGAFGNARNRDCWCYVIGLTHCLWSWQHMEYLSRLNKFLAHVTAKQTSCAT